LKQLVVDTTTAAAASCLELDNCGAPSGTGTPQQYMYWIGTRPTRNLFQWMLDECEPREPFFIADNPSPGAPKARAPEMQSWIGNAGIVSTLHYDASHNVYVQLHGSKTFVLFSPHFAPDLQICPFLHPGDGSVSKLVLIERSAV
jgi:hypothetical protein